MSSPITLSDLFSSTPIQVSILMGISTLAFAFYFALCRLGKGGLKSKRPLIVNYFSEPLTAGTAPEFKNLVLISKTHDTHDTIVLRFALPHHGRCLTDGTCGSTSATPAVLDLVSGRKVISIAGIAPSKHVQIRANIGGEMIQRSFSPTSCAVDEAHCGLFDLHIKVYRPDPSRGLAGGLMSCYLDSLAIGSSVEMRGPTGLVQYAGNGSFLVGTSTPNKPRKVVAGKHLVLIAGGSGITPIIAVLKAVLHGKLGGMRVPKTKESSLDPLSPLSPTTQAVQPLARREYQKGECRHSFYESSETTLDESSNEIERITLIYCNHTVADVMFKDWLIGDDVEHSCYGAFAALAEAGSVVPATDEAAKRVPDGFRAKAIDVSMNYFVSRPTAADTKAMTAANKIWADGETERWGLPSRPSVHLQSPRSPSATRTRVRSNSKTDIASSPKSPASANPGLTSPISVATGAGATVVTATKTEAIVTRRYAAGRLSEATLKECMNVGGEAMASSATRSKFAAEIGAAAGISGADTVALLCGPPGLLNEVARPALLAAGVAKDKILLA